MPHRQHCRTRLSNEDPTQLTPPRQAIRYHRNNPQIPPSLRHLTLPSPKLSLSTQSLRNLLHLCQTLLPDRIRTQNLPHPIPHPRRRLRQILPAFLLVSILLSRYAALKGYTTFAYDHLGIRASDHPDAIQTVQAPLEITMAHFLIQMLRSGSIASTSFQKIVGVGHSLGSELTNAITDSRLNIRTISTQLSCFDSIHG
jgi:hypothetical protein